MGRLFVAGAWLAISAAAIFAAAASVHAFLASGGGGRGYEPMCILVSPSAGFYGCAGAFAGLGLGLLLPLFVAETQRDLKKTMVLGLVLVILGGPASYFGWLGPFLSFLGAGFVSASALGLLM